MGDVGRSLLLSSLRPRGDDSFDRLADGGISSGVKSSPSSSELSDMCRNLDAGGVFNRLRLSRDSFLKQLSQLNVSEM